VTLLSRGGSASDRDHERAIRELERAWSSKRGLPGFASAVNHKQIGMRFVWTGVAFLLVGGVEGLLLRIQLARSENTFLGPELYNQIFTMHGTTMMFLFAVPVLEGLAMYLTPLQIGTRDLPFPRLNAFGYWVYLAGGLLLNWSLVTGSIPDSGWFAYVPLTGPEFSPTRALDFWLLGVTFVEIAGIIGAIELIVVILRFRAPGMTLGRIPLFVWSVLVMAGMILIAFPFVITASLLLELERKFGAPFYDPEWGGNPLLWQHLFWIFGHPEVYIILLPAIGVVSAVVAAHVGRRIVAYPLVVASLLAIAIISFGLWVHHMFAVGLPVMVISLFAVASYFIAIPSGIQVFAWIATVWDGRPRWTTPMWFVVGFLFIFVLGGITGVMVATAPWDLQSHDTFFVVAHFHYVLIGGMVFPLLAGLHHWFPKMTGRLPSDAAGKVSAAVMFVGFNVTFFPQHWLGMQGMLRRVYTYDRDLGWDTSNLVSTIGAFVLAAGFVIFFANLAWAWRAGPTAGADPYTADSLEWIAASPPQAHNFHVIPTVSSVSPAWDRRPADLAPEVLDAIEVTGRPWRNRREVVQTSVVDAVPERIVALPGTSYWPLVAATALATAIVGVLVDWWTLSAAGVIGLAASLIGWNESNRRASSQELSRLDPDDPQLHERHDADSVFAEYTSVGRSAVWWASLLGAAALATITGAMVYAYGYLWLSADDWPLGGQDPRPLGEPLLALGLLAGAWLLAPTTNRGRLAATVSAAAAVAAVVVQVAALVGSDVTIDADAYQALVVTLEGWSAVVLGSAVAVRLAAVVLMGPGRRIDSLRDADRAFFTCAVLMWGAVWVTLHAGARWL
jgi:cytochrome c oxidase subunit I+III